MYVWLVGSNPTFVDEKEGYNEIYRGLDQKVLLTFWRMFQLTNKIRDYQDYKSPQFSILSQGFFLSAYFLVSHTTLGSTSPIQPLSSPLLCSYYLPANCMIVCLSIWRSLGLWVRAVANLIQSVDEEVASGGTRILILPRTHPRLLNLEKSQKGTDSDTFMYLLRSD